MNRCFYVVVTEGEARELDARAVAEGIPTVNAIRKWCGLTHFIIPPAMKRGRPPLDPAERLKREATRRLTKYIGNYLDEHQQDAFTTQVASMYLAKVDVGIAEPSWPKFKEFLLSAQEVARKKGKPAALESLR